MKHFSHLNTAVHLVGQYRGEMPFSIFLRSFFSQHSKYGSKDRKRIAHLCYCYFRLGKSLPDASTEEKMIAGLYLSEDENDVLLAAVRPNWKAHRSLDERIAFLQSQIGFKLTDIFPWKNELSEGMDFELFCRSFLVQPDLFLRIRPGQQKMVFDKLATAGIQYHLPEENCIALPNGTRVEDILLLDKEAVVQDLNSQRTGDFFMNAGDLDRKIFVWDCCAGSGGKSMLAYDLFPGCKLTMSDIRSTIILNLNERLNRAGVKNYYSFVADIVNEKPPFSPLEKFDLIICDVPCSGSGTWSRTPEQLKYFDARTSIESYFVRQKKILLNAIPYLKPGGRMVYITCSVFRRENEGVLDELTRQLPVEVVRKQMLTGYGQRSDNMFVAVIKGI